eukprot:UN11552
MNKRLKSLGFETDLLENQSSCQLTDYFNNLNIKQTGPIFLYFTGHGGYLKKTSNNE